jgi:serine phosphatase RsbU (regulator of sigma subunit)/PAS domain-containing protein
MGRLAATVERLREQVHQAQTAASGNALIELARGILVERLGCGPVQAARQLHLLAESAGISRLELAADIVNRAAGDRLSEAAVEFVTEVRTPADHAVPEEVVRLRTAESGVLAATDTQAVAQALLEHALAPIGACAVAVWTAASDGSLSLAGTAGFSAAEAARWHYVPPTVATLARKALTERTSVWATTLTEAGIPSIGWSDMSGGGRAVLPAGTGGRILGVLEICWADRLPPQPVRIQRQVEALAELCAHTLEVNPPAPLDESASELVDVADGLGEPALVLRPQVDHDGAVTDFRIHHVNAAFATLAGRPPGVRVGALLLEAYPLAAESGGLFEKIERVHATGEAFRARRMPLPIPLDQLSLSVVVDLSISRHGNELLLIWRSHDEAARLAGLLQHAQRLGRIAGFEENPNTGEVTWNAQLFSLCGLPATAPPIPLERLPRHAHPDDATAIRRFLRTLLHHHRAASTAFRLHRPDGSARYIRVIAEPVLDARSRLVAVRGAYQDVSAQHWTEVALAATRDQLAHSEARAAENNRLALLLQQAIMPPPLAPRDALGLRIAVRYRPAEKEHLVGGDWYDTARLASGQLLLAVGDVAGHGIEAATGMVALRNALRGLAATGAAPGQLLGWLNKVACDLTGDLNATAICALYEPRTRVMSWARAGHLPPLLVRDGRASALPLTRGMLLGAFADAEHEDGEVQLAPGDRLLLYTDGLIERRDRPLEHSLEQLVAAAAAHASRDLDEHLDQLLIHSRSDTDDDTCLIGVQLLDE